MFFIIAYCPNEYSNWLNKRERGCNITFDGSQNVERDQMNLARVRSIFIFVDHLDASGRPAKPRMTAKGLLRPNNIKASLLKGSKKLMPESK